MEREENMEESMEEREENRKESVKDGEVKLPQQNGKAIQVFTIIGEIEGHDIIGNSTKTTKYEHIIPSLVAIEEEEQIGGALIILNTMGGDVEAGLAIAELIASLKKPTVSLVLGGSHSIGVPIAVSANYSFIVPTGTMVIHPVRLNGMVIGVQQTFDYFKQMQNRIAGFICNHCSIAPERLDELMMETEVLTKDVGSILVGEEAVKEGIIDEVGGIHEALAKLHAFIDAIEGVH